MFKGEALSYFVLILAIALLLGQGTLALLIGLITLALIAARLWSKVALRSVTYSRQLTPDRAFVGDEVELRLHIRNAKVIGVPGLHIQDLVSTKVHVQGAKLTPHTQPGARLMERWTSLRSYQAVTWRLSLQCLERGYYPFGPVRLEATDPWGLYASETELPARIGLVVYPRLIPLQDLQLDPHHPLGELRAPRQLLTDPARTVGIRDYQRDDPFKAIHWGATARRGQLQTRVYEPTTSLELAIALDLDTFERYWEGIQPELAEWMISAAASIATAAGEGGWSFGLYANCATADGEALVRIPPSRSPAQLPVTLETLAKIVPYSIAPMAALLRRLGPTLPWGSALFVISAVPSEAMQQALLRLAERGRRVQWLYCGEGATPRVPGVDIRRASRDRVWSAEPVRGGDRGRTPPYVKIGPAAQ